MVTSRNLDERIEALIDLRVRELELLAAMTAAAYWRERTGRPFSERLNFRRGGAQPSRFGLGGRPGRPDAIVHRWPRA